MMLENQYQRQSEMRANDSPSIPNGNPTRGTTSPKTFQLNYNKSSMPTSQIMPILSPSPSTTRNLGCPNVATNRENSQTSSTGSNKFTFKSLSRPQVSRPMVTGAVTPSTSSHLRPSLEAEVEPPAQSQHLVASLLSDLDSSDIWADF